MTLSVDRLRLLWEVANRGSMSAAARAIGYTPSAISQQLAQLEREAGVALLHRTSSGVTLTAVGRLLHDRTERILDELAGAHADLAGTSDRVDGTVRLAAFPTAIGNLISPAVRALASRHPDLVVKITDLEPHDAIAAVTRGDVDIAVIHHYDHLPANRPAHDLITTELLVEPVYLAAANGRLQGTRPIDVGDLATCCWIAPPPSTACGDAVRHACRVAGFEPDVVIMTDDLTLTAELVAADHGVALLPQLAVRPRGDLTVRALARPYRRITEFAVRAGTARHPNTQAVLAMLRAAATPLVRTPPG